MGAISSMCCEGDDPVKRHPRDPLPPVKQTREVPMPLVGDPPQRKKTSQQHLPISDKRDNQRSKSRERLKKDKKQEDVVVEIQNYYPPPVDKKSIKWQNFQINCKIGGGGFGEVFLAELKQNKDRGIIEKYAIKRVLKSEIIKKKLTSNLQLEKRILQQSKSNFITSLYYAFRDEKFLYFVMEWAQGGDTYSLICQGSKRVEDFKAAGEKAVRFILACLILGMEQLHKKNIMYRDLKPENVLIFDDGYVKLTDFGLAKEIRDDELSKTEAGTNIYYAPEMVLKQGYGKQIDFWTIGIYAYEMSNFSPPFSGQQIKDRLKVKRLVKSAEQNRTWKNPSISEQLKSFINDLLKFNPKERLGCNGWDQMKDHQFFSSAKFDWKALETMKMQSPIKAIIDKHKLKHKTYNPNEMPKKWAADATSSSGNKQLEGWTYVYEKE